MSLRTELIGTTTAELMERLEEDYADEAEAEVAEVLVAVLVTTEEHSVVEYRTSEEIWAHKYGLVKGVERSLLRSGDDDAD